MTTEDRPAVRPVLVLRVLADVYGQWQVDAPPSGHYAGWPVAVEIADDVTSWGWRLIEDVAWRVGPARNVDVKACDPVVAMRFANDLQVKLAPFAAGDPP